MTGKLVLNAITNDKSIDITGASVTGATSLSVADINATFNTSGACNGISVNVTNTASDATSTLFRARVGSATKFSVNVAGNTLLDGNQFFSTDNTYDIGADGTTRPRIGFFGTQLNVQKNAIGNTPTDGLNLANVTAAAAGAQQYSTAIRFTGQGWKTNATAASQACDFRIYNQPVQGSSVPTLNALFDFSVNGAAFTTRFTFSSLGVFSNDGQINCGGNITNSGSSGKVICGSSGSFQVNTKSLIKSSSDGLIELSNAGGTDFTRLNFGGTTSSFPALTRAAAVLEVKLADNSARAQLYANTLRTDQTTVAALPAAATAGAGARAFVTDALAPAFGSTVAGSGAVSVPVYSDGSNWVVG
jgi:hypothetical protein